MPSTKPSQGRTLKLILIIGIVVVLIVVALVVGIRIGNQPTTTSGPSATSGSERPSATPSKSSDSLPRSDVLVGKEAGSTMLGPAVTGYPHTTSGAVASALNYATAVQSAEYFDDDVRHLVQTYIYVSAAVAKKLDYPDDAMAQARTKRGIDEHGKATDPSKTVYDAAYMRYGAFKIINTDAEKVTVQLWFPRIVGTSVTGSTDGLTTQWVYFTMTMQWANGDWRIANTSIPKDEVPTPADAGNVVTSFAERKKLLGDGWQMPKNALESVEDSVIIPGVNG